MQFLISYTLYECKTRVRRSIKGKHKKLTRNRNRKIQFNDDDHHHDNNNSMIENYKISPTRWKCVRC